MTKTKMMVLAAALLSFGALVGQAHATDPSSDDSSTVTMFPDENGLLPDENGLSSDLDKIFGEENFGI